MASNEEMYVDGIPISDLRVVDLKEQLEKRGLSKSGSKTVLAKRLRDYLASENSQEGQAGKDPSAAPNLGMKTCGNDLVAEYLEKQQQMLQAAKLAAARSTASSEASTSPASSGAVSTPATPDRDSRLGSPTTPGRRTKAGQSKSPRRSITEQESGGSGVCLSPTSVVRDVVQTTLAPIDEENALVVTTQNIPAESAPASVEVPVGPNGAVQKVAPAEEPVQPDFGSGRLDVVPEDKTAAQVQEVAQPDAKIPVDAMETSFEQEPPVQSPVLAVDANQGTLDETTDSGIVRDTGRYAGGHEIGTKEESSSPSSGEGDNGSKDRFDDIPAITTTAATPLDDLDDVEMEISAPINAAEELFETFNTVTTTSTEGGRKKEIETEVSTFSVVETEIRDIPQRKRKWVAATLTKRAAVSISSDSLKDIVASVKESVKEEVEMPAIEEEDSALPPKRIVISRDTGEADETEDLDTEPSRERRVVEIESRPPGKVTEDGFVRLNSPSPARHPTSNLIHIRGLTRPLTISQLFNLLATFGEFSKEEFWIDNVKSHCIVKFSNEDEAALARSRLHNVMWPPDNKSSILRVDFASQEDLDRHQQGSAARISRRSTEAERSSVSEKPAREVREVRTERRGSVSPSRTEQPSREHDRSFDRGKTWRSGESPPTDPRGAGARKRVSASPERRGEPARKEGAQPAKLLDELFRKTKATPCIYWLPLSIEQAKEKERERKKRQQERQERLKRMDEEDRERRREPYRRQSPGDYRGRRR